MVITATQPKIYTPLIVLSFSEQGIKDALQNVGQGGFESIVGSRDVYTFPGHSSNFTKLTHTFNVGGVGMRLRLEIIDPVLEFENKFLSLDMEDLLANDLFNVLGGGHDSDVGEFFANLEEGNNNIPGTAADIVQASLQQKVWISYGHGTNTEEDWAGPFKYVLTGARLKVDTRNVKKLILDFTPNNDAVTNPIGWYGKRSFSVYGQKSTATGMTNSFKYGEITSPVGNKDYAKPTGTRTGVGNWQKFVDKAGVDITDSLKKFFENFDVHAALLTCIRGMVSAATNSKNVVVLIPNINVYAIKAIATAVERGRGSGVDPEDHPEVFLRDAAEKVFHQFGAELVAAPVSDQELAPTNFRVSIELYNIVNTAMHLAEDPYYIQMKSETTKVNGHRDNIQAALAPIQKALQSTSRSFDPVFLVESNPEIIAKFQGAPGIHEKDSNIVFFGDKGLIRNIVYAQGAESADLLHPMDKEFMNRGITIREDYPVFRMNTDDADILSLDVIKDKVYLAALLHGYSTQARSMVGQVNDVLKDAGEAYLGAPPVASITKTNLGMNSEAAEVFATATKFVIPTSAKSTMVMDPAINNNPIGIVAAAYEKLSRWAVQINITTLPRFNLSNISVLGQLCALEGSMPNALIPGNPPSVMSSAGKESGWFSGGYYIVGYEHQISSTGIATSKFVLVKILGKGDDD